MTKNKTLKAYSPNDFYSIFKEHFPNYTGLPTQEDLNILQDYINKEEKAQSLENDILVVLENAFPYTRDWDIIFSEENLNQAISEMLSYLYHVYLPAQANFVDHMEEYHVQNAMLYYAPRTQQLHFGSVDRSYWAQYTNKVDLLSSHGTDRKNLMRFLVTVGNDHELIKRYLKFFVYGSYIDTPKRPEGEAIFF